KYRQGIAFLVFVNNDFGISAAHPVDEARLPSPSSKLWHGQAAGFRALHSACGRTLFVSFKETVMSIRSIGVAAGLVLALAVTVAPA
ncbi:MAG TPA: hypothetical protein PK264_22005, partial [Hyphomicrobiaceae bacterium]|nr:hypothetical protein [Hyphomicrobiaceae bacterium]